MTARVDVLALMDAAAERAADEASAHDMTPHDANQLRAARAAVAELIDASAAMLPEPDRFPELPSVIRLRAALAACGVTP